MVEVYRYYPTDTFGSNTYLIRSGDDFAVVDPSVPYSQVLMEHPELEGRLRYILLTHAHFDHILQIDGWAEQGAEVIIGGADRESLRDPYRNCYLGFLGVDDGYYGETTAVEDGHRLTFGDGYISVLSCPGHTPGGVSYRLGHMLFVGDTLFAKGGYGRCDLPGGDIDLLERSLIRLLTREADCLFYPGHGDSEWLHDTVQYFS